MSLQDVIDDWRANGETHDADQASAALTILISKYPQTVANIDADKQIRQTQRADLLTQMIIVDVNDEALVTAEFVRFCGAHECKGARRKTAEKAVLGHIEIVKDLEETIRSVAAGYSPAVRRRRAGISVVADLEGRSVDDQKALLQRCPLRRFMTWSCYHSRHLTDPFHGVTMTKAEVQNRLGLGKMPTDKPIVVWCHRLRVGQKAHRPTAFDAKAYEWFRPGGKTAALDGSDRGLREVVHAAIYADQLEYPIEVLR